MICPTTCQPRVPGPCGMSPERAFTNVRPEHYDKAIEAVLGPEGGSWRRFGPKLQVERHRRWFTTFPVLLRDGTPATYYFAERGPHLAGLGTWVLPTARRAPLGTTVHIDEDDKTTAAAWLLPVLGLVVLGAVVLVDKPGKGWP